MYYSESSGKSGPKGGIKATSRLNLSHEPPQPSTTMFTAEIFEFTASDAGRADPKTLAKFSKLYSDEGIKSIYVGIQAEDATQAILLIDKEQYDQNQPLDAFNTPPGKLLEEYFPTARNSTLNFTRVQFPSSYSDALSSPVLVVVYFTLTSGNSWEQLGPLLTQLTDNLKPAKGSHGPLLGHAINKEGVYVAFIGWDSVEDHINAVKEGILADIMNDIRGVADIYPRHWLTTLLSE